MLENLTFFLAMLGYAGLTYTVVAMSRARFPSALWRIVAAIILLHVAMVWSVRYGWDLDKATRHGYGVFVLFHAALLVVAASVMLPERVARRLVVGAFALVTYGALGAVSRLEVVAQYRIPVAVCAVVGIGALVRAYRFRRARLAASV